MIKVYEREIMEEEVEILSRNQEQEKVFFILYQALFYSRMQKEYDIVEIIEETLDQSFEDVSIFIKETSVKILKNYEQIQAQIEPHCTKWKFSRINLILIAILSLGIGEYQYVGNVDKSVIIDVCIKLAKKYGDEKDYRFINAVLDKIL